MLTLDCDTRSIPLHMTNCAAGPVVRATLSRRNLPIYELVATVTGPNDLVLSLAPDDDVPMRGVWRLSLETDCRCFDTQVFVDSCQAPALQGQHIPTAPSVPIVTCCVPMLQPDFSETPVVIGFKAELTVDGMGADAPADLFAPAPTLTTFRFLVDDGELNAAIQPAPPATLWTLLDKAGRTVMQGTLSGTIMSTDNVRPLTCADYYLRFDP